MNISPFIMDGLSHKVIGRNRGLDSDIYMLSRFSCVQLCDPMDCSPPGTSVHGILQARILDWVAISFSGVSSRHRDGSRVSYVCCIDRWVIYH